MLSHYFFTHIIFLPKFIFIEEVTSIYITHFICLVDYNLSHSFVNVFFILRQQVIRINPIIRYVLITEQLSHSFCVIIDSLNIFNARFRMHLPKAVDNDSLFPVFLIKVNGIELHASAKPLYILENEYVISTDIPQLSCLGKNEFFKLLISHLFHLTPYIIHLSIIIKVREI